MPRSAKKGKMGGASSKADVSDVPEEEMSEEYEVEQVVGHREENGVFEYLVRWRGHASTDDTWEAPDNLANAGLIVHKYWYGLHAAKAKEAKQSKDKHRSSSAAAATPSGGVQKHRKSVKKTNKTPGAKGSTPKP